MRLAISFQRLLPKLSIPGVVLSNHGMLTVMGLRCTTEKCSRIGFVGINIIFSMLGVAVLTASCIVRYDHNMADKYLDYSSFQKTLESAKVSVHTPSSLNIAETLDAVCIVFIIIGVLFILLGILGIIGVFVRFKALLITYAVVLSILIVLELTSVILLVTFREKIEGWIKNALKDSIRHDYSGITGNDTNTLRWNFIMHSFRCCGVDRYTDFRRLPAIKWNLDIDIDGVVTGMQIPFACCHVKNDVTCVLRPTSTTSFINKGCYQVMTDWVTNNASIMFGVGVIILLVELILVVLAAIVSCMLRTRTVAIHEDTDPIQTLNYLGGVINNPVFEGLDRS